MKRRLLVAFGLGAGLSLAVAGWALVRNGASARDGLTAYEERILYQVRKVAIAAEAGSAANPLAGFPDVWREAAGHYVEECAVCHGPAGRGDGLLGPKLFPPATNLTLDRVQQLSDAELHHIISEGIRMTGMPAMAGSDSPEEIWKLVSLIRQLPELDAAALKQAADAHRHGGDGHKH